MEKLTNKELELKGVIINKLRYGSTSYGLGGTVLIKFVLPNSLSSNYVLEQDELPNELPPTKLKNGDHVGIRNSKSKYGKDYEFKGIVYKIEKSEITISTDLNTYFPPLEHEFLTFSIDKLNPNDQETEKSVEESLEILKSIQNSRSTDNLYSAPAASFKPISKTLDQTQMDTVNSILATPDEASEIKGLPGTGKTTTMIELVLQLIKNGNKVLICSKSQVSLDSILDKLFEFKKECPSLNPTAIGQPSSIYSPRLSNYFLDNKILNDEYSYQVIRESRKEIDSLFYNLIFIKEEEKENAKNKINQLLEELVKTEKSFANQVLKDSNVILTSTKELSSPYLKDLKVDYIITDSSDSVYCIPVQNLTTFNHQTINSKNITTLTKNYRNNHIISLMNSSSNNSTGDKNNDQPPLTMIDTSGCDMEENQDVPNDEECISNEGEVTIIQKHLENLIKSGVDQKDIGIITLSNCQIKLLKLKLSSQYPDVEVGTPKQFEGREIEIIFISTVRSNNSPHKIRNLEEINRMVQFSITRSKKQCIFIGNSDTFSLNPQLDLLIQHIRDNGLYKSVL
ncbi:hypothetical protein DICPUDRAFT_75407 [Dictyostelium purpureum]|uniref:DNA helicase n=1 Tax=Dictyostelium purpureum TaxID=5786 RepID=F0ZAK8_DICPU|nr:uncharacterized protein DICPUDRAFT_75407 [Dictyostelium purpureum]EGC38991.1 hypothetical protein DICPUDRAFT_75407 [Dictyostelium purpureum]|eukprot:XP_003284444.1 hypothetical protein DICPUDRAFT_75407 [Dictyostelium purpureum]